MSKRKWTRRIGVFHYVKIFALFSEIAEHLNLKENSIWQMFYRNNGNETEAINQIIAYLEEKYQFDKTHAYELLTEEEFKKKFLNY